MTGPPSGTERVRSAEVIGSLCLATDLGMGFPFEHGLNASLTTMRLCDVLGVDSEVSAQAYFVSLLMYVGCNVEADVVSSIFRRGLTVSNNHRIFGSKIESTVGIMEAIPDPDRSWPVRAYQVAVGLPKAARFRNPHFAALCEVAEMLAARVGLPEEIHGIFSFLTERWDGQGFLQRAQGEEIPLPLRIVQVARDATYQNLITGDEAHVVETIRSRGGNAFDPEITETFASNVAEVLGPPQVESAWDQVLAAEQKPWRYLEGDEIDRALAAMGSFADLASPYLSGHSPAVGDIAYRAAKVYGLDERATVALRRAGYLADIGKSGVHPRIWENGGRLTADEWEQVRLHPYHTERVCVRSPFLAPLGAIACAHHERLDGSGYPRSLGAGAMSPSIRLLAVVDAFRSKVEPRAYRPAYPPQEALDLLAGRARQGKLDGTMVSAVAEAVGEEVADLERPAGLTDRECEVIGLVARGLQTKQVARAIGIAPKTADRHIQNAYRKMDVSTRAAATLFATEHGLVPWGDLPSPTS